MDDEETDTWVALEAATRNVVVLLRLRALVMAAPGDQEGAANESPAHGTSHPSCMSPNLSHTPIGVPATSATSLEEAPRPQEHSQLAANRCRTSRRSERSRTQANCEGSRS